LTPTEGDYPIDTASPIQHHRPEDEPMSANGEAAVGPRWRAGPLSGVLAAAITAGACAHAGRTPLRPSVISVTPNQERSGLPKLPKRENAGNEDSCKPCKVLNGIYMMQRDQELTFPFEVARPSTVRIRIYSTGRHSDQLRVALYQEGYAEAAWVQAAGAVKEGVSTINGSKDLSEANVARGSRWRIVVHNVGPEPLSAAIMISSIEQPK
jgi:hypothetical protein